MVDDDMSEVYKDWLRLEPKNRPNLVVTGSATVRDSYIS